MALQVCSWSDMMQGKLNSLLPAVQERGCAVSVGRFDGPHLGHEALVQCLLAQAAYVPGVATFMVPPRFARLACRDGTVISSLEQRLEWFEKAGLAFAVLIDFSPEFSKINGKDFLSMLLQACRVRFITEGSDFRFGYNGSCGTADMYRFAQEQNIAFCVPAEVLYEQERISSSRIRAAIATGNFSLVTALLGRPFALDCRRMLWARTAEQLYSCLPFEQILPKDGEYAASLHLKNGTVIDSVAVVENGIVRVPIHSCNDGQYIGTIQFVP